MNKGSIGISFSLELLIASDVVHISNCYSKPLQYYSTHRNVWPLLKDRAHVYNYTTFRKNCHRGLLNACGTLEKRSVIGLVRGKR